ncbi:hypothetical protein Tsp_01681 [Trichinella spiralis]|uniref:hypothetical protein n=1 Tax=Trichinella spiralis TaxID=6334 RepID=UPI0001EFC697|nr:hypothetical protein Tsp_01681 [Trichinella spiralis]
MAEIAERVWVPFVDGIFTQPLRIPVARGWHAVEAGSNYATLRTVSIRRFRFDCHSDPTMPNCRATTPVPLGVLQSNDCRLSSTRPRCFHRNKNRRVDSAHCGSHPEVGCRPTATCGLSALNRNRPDSGHVGEYGLVDKLQLFVSNDPKIGRGVACCGTSRVNVNFERGAKIANRIRGIRCTPNPTFPSRARGQMRPKRSLQVDCFSATNIPTWAN